MFLFPYDREGAENYRAANVPIGTTYPGTLPLAGRNVPKTGAAGTSTTCWKNDGRKYKRLPRRSPEMATQMDFLTSKCLARPDELSRDCFAGDSFSAPESTKVESCAMIDPTQHEEALSAASPRWTVKTARREQLVSKNKATVHRPHTRRRFFFRFVNCLESKGLLPSRNSSILVVASGGMSVFGSLLFLLLMVLSCSSLLTVASAQNPISILLDFTVPFRALDSNSHQGRKFQPTMVNGRRLVCGASANAATLSGLTSATAAVQLRDIALRAAQSKIEDADEDAILSSYLPLEGLGTADAKLWSTAGNAWSPEAQTLRYLSNAKLAWLGKQCHLFRPAGELTSIFDVCIGRSITLYRHSHGIGLGSEQVDLGFHDIFRDEIYSNGTIVQYYSSTAFADKKGAGKNNQSGSAVLRMECSADSLGSIQSAVETAPNHFVFRFESPQFCDWRLPNVDNENSDRLPRVRENREPRRETPPLGSLLNGLQQWCYNYTDGNWWMYEYCHPDSIIQFHEESNGELADNTTYLLGTLYGSLRSIFAMPKFSAKPEPPPPDPVFTRLRSPYMRPADLDKSAQWKLLPLELVPLPSLVDLNAGRVPRVASENLNILDEPLQALELQLTNGSSCGIFDGQPLYRTTRVLFFCPESFSRRPHNQIVRVIEIGFCRYEVYIATPLACSHPALLPQRTPKPHTVICYPEDFDATATAALTQESTPTQDSLAVA